MNAFYFWFIVLTLPATAKCVRRFLTEPEVARAVQLLEDGATVQRVAQRFGVSVSVVSRLWSRFRETGLCSRRPGQGRQRATTQQEDRYLQQMARRNRYSTAPGLRNDFVEATNVRISESTVRNRLHEGGLRSRIPARCPQLTARHRADRLSSPGSTRPGSCAIGGLYSSQMKAGSTFQHVTDL